MFAKIQQIGTIRTEIVDCNLSDCSQFIYSQTGKWDGDNWMVMGRAKLRQALETPPLTRKLREITSPTHYVPTEKFVTGSPTIVRPKEKKQVCKVVNDLPVPHRKRCIQCARKIEEERRILKLDICSYCGTKVEKKVGHMVFDHKTAPYIQVTSPEILQELRRNSRRG